MKVRDLIEILEDQDPDADPRPKGLTELRRRMRGKQSAPGDAATFETLSKRWYELFAFDPGLVQSWTYDADDEGIWRDDERGGTLVKDEPVIVHCYTTPADMQDDRNLAELGSFCKRMGREARQGEVGLVVGDEYFAIRDFGEE